MSKITTLVIDPTSGTTLKPQPEHFEKAADLIERGWTKGSVDDEHGNYCMLGALGKTVANSPMYGYELSKAWGLRIDAPTLDDGDLWFVEKWNDAPRRRRRDVAGLLRRTAKQLRRQQEAN